ncbi:LAME_0G01970g1_1 [Lachancea meyersii CBS 8951]|uniref:Post-GPI attachment to proteins factor 3 n=1 Tax=Lachancea meyersii CBS 8951 TaxID=1266667 RepID=A0A1G4K5R5_9SACH|nr:LAME_0G01970g1_1 [Lachancea meyersii CBS 8951]
MLALHKLLIFITALKVAQGSIGDRLDEFIECTEDCQAVMKCPGFDEQLSMSFIDESQSGFYHASSLSRNLLLWDCASHCDYQCQHIITKMRIQNGEPIVQFHGKWPFKRIFGMQELFSTVFSMANFMPHYRGYQLLQREIRSSSSSHRNVRSVLNKYLYVAIAGMLAWSSSTIFHFRDLEITEKLDYFFAGATVLSGFHAILIRVARLDRQNTYRHLVSGLVVLIFGMHIVRQYLDWSYTYNMRFNVFFGVLQYVLLLLLASKNYRRLALGRMPRKAHYMPRQSMIFKLCVVPVALVVSTSLFMSCELFDFFSYRWQIDAHAIWHACTVLPSWKLYDFFLDDYHYLDACDRDNED